MKQEIRFDPGLIKRYDTSGPRYTSYPTVAQFHSGITNRDYRRWTCNSNADMIPRPLSLYFHIPFCDTVCFYCACNKIATGNHDKARVYLDYLYREIELQASQFDRDRIVEQLHWGGGTPTFLDSSQITGLMNVISRNFSLRHDDQGEYSIEIDPRSIDADKLSVLRSAGFNRVSLGVQDLDPAIQKAVNRIQSMDITRCSMEWARNLGFRSINIDLMYGLPLQTVESFSATLKQVTELGPDRLAVYNYAHLPARFKPQRRINEADLPPADVKLEILRQTIAQLTDAGYVYIGMDHFARPDDELTLAQREGTLQRNFQGYSTRGDCDIVGMGVSAIGRVCDNYSQNTTSLEDYYKRIDSGILPIERGIELEPDDLLRREVINGLMCNFRLDLHALEAKWDFTFWHHFSTEHERILKMQDDGLLTLDDGMITVTPAGRLLVRNICMVFDRYIKDKGRRVTFSKVI